MKCLSIRAPWPWEIAHGGKRNENRGEGFGGKNYRGPLLLHMSKGCTRAEYASACEFIERARREIGFEGPPVPPLESMPRGCIIGVCRVVEWVWHPVAWTNLGGVAYEYLPSRGDRPTLGYQIGSHSGQGRCGSLVLANIEAIEPVPLPTGKLGIFNVDPGRDILERLPVDADLAKVIVGIERMRAAYARAEGRR